LEGIMKLFPQISKDQVILELFSFASNFDVLKLLINDGVWFQVILRQRIS
jgi:hypothetical protein